MLIQNVNVFWPLLSDFSVLTFSHKLRRSNQTHSFGAQVSKFIRVSGVVSRWPNVWFEAWRHAHPGCTYAAVIDTKDNIFRQKKWRTGQTRWSECSLCDKIYSDASEKLHHLHFFFSLWYHGSFFFLNPFHLRFHPFFSPNIPSLVLSILIYSHWFKVIFCFPFSISFIFFMRFPSFFLFLFFCFFIANLNLLPWLL